MKYRSPIVVALLYFSCTREKVRRDILQWGIIVSLFVFFLILSMLTNSVWFGWIVYTACCCDEFLYHWETRQSIRQKPASQLYATAYVYYTTKKKERKRKETRPIYIEREILSTRNPWKMRRTRALAFKSIRIICGLYMDFIYEPMCVLFSLRVDWKMC